MSPRQHRITERLATVFAPTVLTVRDESARHAGHAGAAPGGETHFAVVLVCARFDGAGRVQRSRLVHEALAAEFATGLHALALSLHTPAEYAVRVGSTP